MPFYNNNNIKINSDFLFNITSYTINHTLLISNLYLLKKSKNIQNKTINIKYFYMFIDNIV